MDVIHEITPLLDKDCFYICERYKQEFTYPIHTHTEYELNYIERAPGVRRIVGDSIETIGDYDLVLITGRELEHVWEQGECNSPQVREITIQFSPALLAANGLINKNQFATIKAMLEKAQCGLCFPHEAVMKVYDMLDKLPTEQQGFYAVIKFLTILYELSLYTAQARTLSSSSFAQIDPQSDSRRVLRVQNFITQHYQEEIRLERMAELCGMTPSSFSRFIKLRTGRTLSEYVIDIRIGYAARLLVDTSETIAEVCYACGFNNLSNFNRVFKKKKGCSPKVFRDNYKKRKIVF